MPVSSTVDRQRMARHALGLIARLWHAIGPALHGRPTPAMQAAGAMAAASAESLRDIAHAMYNLGEAAYPSRQVWQLVTAANLVGEMLFATEPADLTKNRLLPQQPGTVFPEARTKHYLDQLTSRSDSLEPHQVNLARSVIQSGKASTAMIYMRDVVESIVHSRVTGGKRHDAEQWRCSRKT